MQKDFRWFFAGQTVSLLGSSMAPVALAYAVLDASGNTSQLGVVLVAGMVPLLAFLLVGGATASRLGAWPEYLTRRARPRPEALAY